MPIREIYSRCAACQKTTEGEFRGACASQAYLDSLEPKQRIGLVRKTIGQFLIQEGLLELPENN